MSYLVVACMNIFYLLSAKPQALAGKNMVADPLRLIVKQDSNSEASPLLGMYDIVEH